MQVINSSLKKSTYRNIDRRVYVYVITVVELNDPLRRNLKQLVEFRIADSARKNFPKNNCTEDRRPIVFLSIFFYGRGSIGLCVA